MGGELSVLQKELECVRVQVPPTHMFTLTRGKGASLLKSTQIRNSKKDQGRTGGRSCWWASQVAGGSRQGEDLPVHAVDRVRLVMVPSLLVSHVNRQGRVEWW
jgi:hypothetical protein